MYVPVPLWSKLSIKFILPYFVYTFLDRPTVKLHSEAPVHLGTIASFHNPLQPEPTPVAKINLVEVSTTSTVLDRGSEGVSLTKLTGDCTLAMKTPTWDLCQQYFRNDGGMEGFNFILYGLRLMRSEAKPFYSLFEVHILPFFTGLLENKQ